MVFINEKEKLVAVIAVISVCIIISICAVLFINNKNSKNAPLNHLFNAINYYNVSEIPKAFHEYCSLSVEQNISEEKFENYMNEISQDFGSDYHFSYKIIHMSNMSKEDIKMYEDNAKNIYSNYPCLSNGSTTKFDDIYNITTEITIKGKF